LVQVRNHVKNNPGLIGRVSPRVVILNGLVVPHTSISTGSGSSVSTEVETEIASKALDSILRQQVAQSKAQATVRI
jgi:hypothetical protein